MNSAPRPCSRPIDLGRPLPDSPHAVSVCLPTWEDNVGYEELVPRVMQALQAGYPRFVVPPLVQTLFDRVASQLAGSHETLFVFPSQRVAERARDYVNRHHANSARIEPWGGNRLHAVIAPREHLLLLKQYWQHSGEIITSRLAAAALAGQSTQERTDPEIARTLRQRVADFAGADPDDVYLFPTGMAAVYAGYRACQRLHPHAYSVQFGFPYVDILKIQERLGTGVHFYPQGVDEDLDRVEVLLRESQLMGVFCEFPGNPLLTSPDLNRLSRLTHDARVPLLVDDTLGAILNTHVLPACDLAATSLTKYFSGAGDVMGGSLILNPERPLANELRRALEAEYEDLNYPGDSEVLERNSRDVGERVARINATTEALCEWLRAHPAVARIDYPRYRTPDRYFANCRESAGAGGLFSMTLIDEARTAPRFFDSLNLNKGPNLGTSFTLCCPYTILAHYNELDFAEQCGISRYLIRVSIGLESPEWLRQQFDDALTAAVGEVSNRGREIG